MKTRSGMKPVETMSANALPYQAPPPGGVALSENEKTAVTVVRRLGYVALKIHHTVMNDLIAVGDQQGAERFNNAFKPMVDYLLSFELPEVSNGL